MRIVEASCPVASLEPELEGLLFDSDVAVETVDCAEITWEYDGTAHVDYLTVDANGTGYEGWALVTMSGETINCEVTVEIFGT